MIVAKFGGAALRDAEAVRRVLGILAASRRRQPVVVVSALGETTRGLLDAVERAGAGDAEGAVSVLDRLRSEHERLAAELLGEAPACRETIERHFEELATLVRGLVILGEVPPRALDKILAYGELLSSEVVCAALQAADLPATWFDSRRLVVTDGRYGGAAPQPEPTARRLREQVLPALEAERIPVLQGFIGSSREGATTTLGFEGSDLTATVVAACLGAEEVEVWKDVAGLMSADPAVCPEARTVPACSYAEAAELTRFGAKVLHPGAIAPAARHAIPVYVRSVRDPDGRGTRIDATGRDGAPAVTSITSFRPVSVAVLEAAGGDPSELLRRSAEALARQELAPLLATLAGDALLVVCPSRERLPRRRRYRGRSPATRALAEALSPLGATRVEDDRAVVTLVGHGVGRDGSLPGTALSALEGVGVEAVAFGPAGASMSLLVGGDAAEESVRALHRAVFAAAPRPAAGGG